MEINNNIYIYNGDCLELMKDIQDKSVSLILCDLPYAINGMSWDSLIPFDELWNEYNRILKDDGHVVLFCSGLFTLKVIESNLQHFRYKLIWKKNVPTGMSGKNRPMKYYEEICVFNKSSNLAVYNPQPKERVGVGKACYNYEHYCGESNHIKLEKKPKIYDPDFVRPSDVLEFNVVPNRKKLKGRKKHPTEKPVQLLEYLIKTYSNENDLVLDNCMGSASTGEACFLQNRKFIGIEKNECFFDSCVYRLKSLVEEKANVLF